MYNLVCVQSPPRAACVVEASADRAGVSRTPEAAHPRSRPRPARRPAAANANAERIRRHQQRLQLHIRHAELRRCLVRRPPVPSAAQ